MAANYHLLTVWMAHLPPLPPDESRQSAMKPAAPTIQSFIVKIRLMDLEPEEQTLRWYGQIVHVPSGNKAYIRSLAEISDFIAPYLREMGVEP